MEEKRIDLSIIIRTKNEAENIGSVLEKIYLQDYDGFFEVIAIDSGSSDRTLEIVSCFPEVKIYSIEPENFTFGYALNYGFKLAKGKFIVYLSAHCIPTNGQWLSNLVQPLNDPCIAATYGRQEPIKAVNPIEELELIYYFLSNTNYTKAIFSNSNCAIKKEVLEKYPFDEKISFLEDFLWRNQLPEKYKIKYVPLASVYHSHPFRIKYWYNRLRNNEIANFYLKTFYNLRGYQASGSIFVRQAKWVNKLRKYFIFFINNRYYRFIFILFLFELIRLFAYIKAYEISLHKYR
jgi:rhamnosyltransferase